MKRALVLALALLGACGVNSSGAGEWTPIETLTTPFVPEIVTDAAPSAFRAANPVQADRVRVVTYNVDEEDAAIDPIALARAIQATPELASAGVFLLQEPEAYPGEASSRAKPIADLLGLRYVYVPEFEKGTDHTQGLAILSAYPIENVMRKELPIAGSHGHAAVSADVVTDAGVLHVITVHLELRTNAAQRLAQLRPAIIDAPPQTLLAGDFNMGPVAWADNNIPVLSGTSAVDQSQAVDAYVSALGFDTPTADSGPTAFKYGIQSRVDAIYTRGLAVTYGGVPRVGPSDHWPMWVDVQVH